MSRDEGFAVADVATAKHTDPKFKRLWRQLGDEAAMNAAASLYEAVLLTSWHEGRRVTADEGAPFWMADATEPTAALLAAGLLDKDGRIPEHAWNSWYGPAHERREQRREAGRIGGQRSRGGSGNSSGGQAMLERPSTGAEAALNPSVPSVPSVRSDRAAPYNGSASLRDIDTLAYDAAAYKAELTEKLKRKMGVES